MQINHLKKYLLPAVTGLCAVLIANGIGRFGYPPIIPSLIQRHWFSVSQADYLGAINLTGYVLGSSLAWKLNHYIKTIDLIRYAMAGAILTFFGCAFHSTFLIYTILRLSAGFAGGVIVVLTPTSIFHHIDSDKKGLLYGILFSGVGIGIALTGTLIPLLLNQGIMFTWLSYGIISLLMFLGFYRGWPANANTLYRPARNESEKSKLRINRVLFLLLISYACNAVGFVPHTVFWVDFIARGLNRGIGQANHMWIILGISAALGPLITGVLADRIGFAKSLQISLLVKGIGVLLPVFVVSLWALVLSSICAGSLAMGISSLAAGRVAELVDANHQKKVWGWMTMIFAVSHASAAYLFSYLFSLTNSYHLLFIIASVTLVIGSILDFFSTI